MLSPILFGMYIDELLLRLSQSGFGCKIGHVMELLGALGYEDDGSLLAPTLYALRQMCEIALNYASEYHIKFNPSKCQLINYCITVILMMSPFILMMLLYLLWEQELIWDTFNIGPHTFKDGIQDASYTLAWNTNSVHHNFSQCSYDVKFKLFNSYCSSLYDCPLWNISDKSSNLFYVTWRK